MFMDQILTLLVDGISSGNLIIVALVATVAVLFNIENIYKFLESRKRSKITIIEEKEGIISRLLINLEKENREALLQVFEDAKGELRFDHFKRAVPHLVFKNNKVSVKISLFSMLELLINAVGGLLFTTAGFLLTITPIIITDLSIFNKLSIYGLALISIFFGIFLALQCLPVVSAYYVKQQIEKNENYYSLKV